MRGTAVEDAAQGVHLVVGVFDVLVGVDGGRAWGNPGEFKGALCLGHVYLRRIGVLWR